MTGVLCVVQARTGSNRLPSKVLADLGGRPLLRFMLDRLDRLAVDRIVVATSVLDRDDPIAELAADARAACVRGSEQDVLGRFVLALNKYPADTIIRLTADCPLVDPAVVGAVLAVHQQRRADFTSNVLPRTFPKGLDVEVASSPALLQAHADATLDRDREHVMPFLYRHPERFRLANLRSGDDLGDESWTVDTPDDLAFVRSVVDRFPQGVPTSWREILAAVGRVSTRPPGIRLRPAVVEDSAQILAWRNQPDAIRFSVSGRAVAPTDHAGWFLESLDDPGRRTWVGLRDDTPVGSVRIDVRDAVGSVSIAVAPSEQGKGTGTGLLGLLQQEMRAEVQVDALTATVHHGNAASLRVFEHVGFRRVGTDGPFAILRWETMGSA